MRVSVVIPCYNSLRWLPETLDAVLAQTYADAEVVLVDDGGSDDLAGWAASRGDDRVRVVRQDNAGVSAARNRGVAEARGELVAFCDSDDVWEPFTLERLVARYDEDPGVGLVYGWYDVIDAAGRPTGRVESYDVEGDAWEAFVTANPVGMSAVLVPAAVFEAAGGFEVNRDRFPIDVEDWDLWIRIAEDHRVSVVPEVLYHHRRHDSNSTSDVDSLEAAYRHLLARVFADQPPERAALAGAAVARIEMILGWHSLNDERDVERALGHRRSALRHHPAIRQRPDYWRLGAAARALQAGGELGYSVVRSGASGLRARLVTPGAGRGRSPADRLRALSAQGPENRGTDRRT